MKSRLAVGGPGGDFSESLTQSINRYLIIALFYLILFYFLVVSFAATDPRNH